MTVLMRPPLLIVGPKDIEDEAAEASLPPFFSQNGLDHHDLRACFQFSSSRFPSSTARPLDQQGGCSYTLLVTPDTLSTFNSFCSSSGSTYTTSTSSMAASITTATATATERGFLAASPKTALPSKCKILQFRPQRYALPVQALKVAKRMHGSLVALPGEMGTLKPHTSAPASPVAPCPTRHSDSDSTSSLSRSGSVTEDSSGIDRRESTSSNHSTGGSDGSDASIEKPTLLVYEMDVLPGVPYSTIQPHLSSQLLPDQYARLQRLLSCLAAFFAQSYNAPPLPSWRASQIPSLVSSSVTARLGRLASELETVKLREIAQRVVREVAQGGLGELPVCLTHGDLLPSNLLVDNVTGELKGVVDWAEGEMLKFGIGLYGVERLLGFVKLQSSEDEGDGAEEGGGGGAGGGGSRADSVHSAQGELHASGKEGEGKVRACKAEYIYYDGAEDLRNGFYAELERSVPALKESKMKTAIKLAREVGVLLWFGFAWDEGRIDRVVNLRDDPVGVAMLEAFLGLG